MAIEIKNLEQLKEIYGGTPYFYKDLSLDLATTKNTNPNTVTSLPGIDVKASFDIQAIANSLFNLLNTSPGQRMLFPKYGINLKTYLFSPINATTGKLIGQTILEGIRVYEPRVNIKFIDVIADPEQYTYEITINIEIPTFRQETQLNFVLDVRRQSFISIPVK